MRFDDNGGDSVIYAAIAGAMHGVPKEIVERQLKHFAKADPAYAAGVKKALGGPTYRSPPLRSSSRRTMSSSAWARRSSASISATRVSICASAAAWTLPARTAD